MLALVDLRGGTHTSCCIGTSWLRLSKDPWSMLAPAGPCYPHCTWQIMKSLASNVPYRNLYAIQADLSLLRFRWSDSWLMPEDSRGYVSQMMHRFVICRVNSPDLPINPPLPFSRQHGSETECLDLHGFMQNICRDTVSCIHPASRGEGGVEHEDQISKEHFTYITVVFF